LLANILDLVWTVHEFLSNKLKVCQGLFLSLHRSAVSQRTFRHVPQQTANVLPRFSLSYKQTFFRWR